MQRIICSSKYQLRYIIILLPIIYFISCAVGGIQATFLPIEIKILHPVILTIPSLFLTVILGSGLFTSNFNFLTANNITRHQFFAATLLSIFSIAAIIAITNGILFESILHPFQNLKGIFHLLYGSGNPLFCTLWWFSLVTLLLLFGWFVTMLYRRANPFFRIVISLMPLIIANVLLNLDKLFNGSLRQATSQGFDRFFGLTKLNPGQAIGNMFLLNLIILLLVWLTLRRMAPQTKT